MEAPQEIKIWIYSTKSESMVSLMKISISSKRAIAVCGEREGEFFIISNKCLTTSNLCIRLPDVRPQFLKVFNKDGYIVLKNPTDFYKETVFSKEFKDIRVIREDSECSYSFWNYSESIEKVLKTIW